MLGTAVLCILVSVLCILYLVYTSPKKFSKGKQAHVGMECSKTSWFELECVNTSESIQVAKVGHETL